MAEGLLFQAFVYLAAAVLSVPLAKRLGLGSVLGYLLAGALIGPFAFGLVGKEGQDVMHFAEFGVVMMLFLIGLELRPALLWRLRGPILGMGNAQVLASAVLLTAIGLALGLGWQPAVAVGLILALSSTAIVLQSLSERGLLKTEGGQRCFSVLLFQDVAVIPLLAVLPLLALHAQRGPAPPDAHGIASLPAWQQALAVAGLIAAIIGGGRLVTRPVFRFIAATRLREVFTAAALLLVVGVALAMQSVGLSPALGTFLAGVVLADSEYRHELEGDIEPFKGLLLGLFFISVGAGIDFAMLAGHPARILSLVVVLVTAKLAVLFLVGRAFRLPLPENLLFTFSLAQGGEFCFVLLSFAMQKGVLAAGVASPLVLVVALSMAVTPLLMIVNERLLQPRLAASSGERQPDAIEGGAPVIVAGFGRFGHIVGRLLKANGVATTVLDLDPEQIDTLRRFGLKVFYGDAGRLDLLRTAGADHARLLLLAVDDPEKANQIAAIVRARFPKLRILARAQSLGHAHQLLHAGAHEVFRETLDSALAMGVQALIAVGFRAHQAHRAARLFGRHEAQSLRELYEIWEDRQAYVDRAGQRVGELERLMEADERDFGDAVDHAWEGPPMRDD